MEFGRNCNFGGFKLRHYLEKEMQDAITNIIGDDLIIIRRNWPCASEKWLALYCAEMAEKGALIMVDEDEFEVVYKVAA